MEYTISLATVIALGVNMLLGLLLSVGIFLFLRFKYKAAAKPFFIGVLVFIVASYMLMQMIHMAVQEFPFGTAIMENPWLYGLYMGVVTALIEETIRLWMYRGILRQNLDNDYNAMMYGAGLSGTEAIISLILGMIMNYLVAVVIFQGNSAMLLEGLTGTELESAKLTLDELTQKPAVDIFMMGVERIAYVMMHMAISVVVWFAANKRDIVYWPYLLALGLRFVYETVVTLLAALELPSVLVQCVAIALAVGCVIAARIIWKREHVAVPVEEK